MNASVTPLNGAPEASLNGVSPLNTLGIIRVEGEDAVRFIHGQLSNDFSLLGLDQARLSAYCTPQGRMLASFIGFKQSAHTLLLVCHRSLLPQTLKRLSMFVMRAKARLSDASAEFQLWGLAGSATQAVPEDQGTSAPWSLSRSTDTGPFAITLYPAAGVRRLLWIAEASHAAPPGRPLPPSLWDWSEVESGIATLSEAAAQAYVPQMLNYESIGGVNFKKGCYPGQEVVARSQFRGTLKRRAYRLHSSQPLQVADAVFVADDRDQPAGSIVQTAANPNGGYDAIVSLQISAAEAGDLRTVNGTPLLLRPMPYPLLEDI
jgi:tRNA-modifying protein YgfZ